jgi:hypothetical protein
MRNNPIIAAASFTMMLALQVSADTFILQDGSKLEGRILREENGNYVIEVQVTRSIKDEKIVAKADVAKIEREKPDIKAFEPIAALVPAPDMLGQDQYAARIQTVEKFLSEHRGSSKTKEARAILATLKQEANEVLAGGIKVNGQIVPPAEYRANALEIDARGREKKIRELINSSNYPAALRAFSEFDREYKGTQPHSSILPLITQTITRYTSEVQEQLAGYDKRLKDREAGLSRMQVDVRRDTEAAIAEELAIAEQQFKKEREARIGWVTVQPFLKPTMEETLNFGKLELNRVNMAISQVPADCGKAYREALQKISAATDETARNAALTEARSAGVSAKYLAILEATAKR